jgi:predicted nuclease with TOPRIM domain
MKPAKAPALPKRKSPVASAKQEAPANDFQEHLKELEKANAKLRGRQQAADRSAKILEVRLSELEARLAVLEERIMQSERTGEKVARRPRTTRRSRDIDPGDSVPEGVAVQDPEPLDEEAEAALEHLQQLGDK